MDYISQGTVIAINVSLLIVSAAAVAVRFYTRRKTRASLGLDDWSILVCLVLCTGLAALTVYAATVDAYKVKVVVKTRQELISRNVSAIARNILFLISAKP